MARGKQITKPYSVDNFLDFPHIINKKITLMHRLLMICLCTLMYNILTSKYNSKFLISVFKTHLVSMAISPTEIQFDEQLNKNGGYAYEGGKLCVFRDFFATTKLVFMLR